MLYIINPSGIYYAVKYTFETWEKHIYLNEGSGIYPSNSPFLQEYYFEKEYPSNSQYPNSMNTNIYPTDSLYDNTFFWINFKNTKDDFRKLDSLLRYKLVSSKYLRVETYRSTTYPDGVDRSTVKEEIVKHMSLGFCWNTKEVKYKIPSDEDINYYLYVGLFGVTVRTNENGYFFEGIGTGTKNKKFNIYEPYKPYGRINLDGIQYDFLEKGNEIEVKNCKEFNFILWEQAQDYLELKFGQNRFNQKFKFVNDKGVLVEFDFKNTEDKGYRIFVP